MKPTTLVATALIPDTRTELKLFEHDGVYSITIQGRGELMNTRVHGSEIALADLACAKMQASGKPRVLVGGLGMGFTLAAALKAAGPDSEVVVAELVPEVVQWNREIMGEPSGHPLNDPRSTVYLGDVADLVREPQHGQFDAILLDVDNGPEAMIRKQNQWLYTIPGLESARRKLRAGGVLAVWSAGPDQMFRARLKHAGFRVEEHIVRPHRKGKGPRHVIWLASP